VAILNLAKKLDEVYSPTRLAQDELLAADARMIPPVDAANLVARPGNVTQTYDEEAYDERAAEQPLLYGAIGTTSKRESAVTAAGLRPQADASTAITTQLTAAVKAAGEVWVAALTFLTPYRMRSPKAKYFYLLRAALLWLGDTVGISSAAIMLGEIPALAVMLSLSASAATVVAGLVGKDVRYMRERRRRQRDENSLPQEAQRFAHLFCGVDDGSPIVGHVLWAAAVVGLLVAAGIFALRTNVDSGVAGVTFAGFALAVALGSFISSFMYADDVADAIDNAHVAFEQASAQLNQAAASLPLAQRLRALAQAESIGQEFEQRGQASMHTALVAKARMLAANPAIVGHGRPEPELAPVGRLHVRGVD